MISQSHNFFKSFENRKPRIIRFWYITIFPKTGKVLLGYCEKIQLITHNHYDRMDLNKEVNHNVQLFFKIFHIKPVNFLKYLAPVVQLL